MGGRAHKAATALPPCITVHDLEQAVAALTAAAALEKPVTLISAPAAAATVGGAWFAHMMGEARALVPAAQAFTVFDCHHHGGRAMAALRYGFDAIIFSGSHATLLKLADMGEDLGVTLMDHYPKSLDLAGRADPEQAAREYLKKA
jgi:fructose/tagatose bisphosphate aldolase